MVAIKGRGRNSTGGYFACGMESETEKTETGVTQFLLPDGVGTRLTKARGFCDSMQQTTADADSNCLHHTAHCFLGPSPCLATPPTHTQAARG